MSKILELAKRIASTGGLETKTTETISGTYDSAGQQRLLSHAYTIGANLTITNGELILSRLADNGTGMTVEFGSDITLSGDGTLMLGDLGQGQPNQDFSASRITGTLPSTVFPTGHALQVINTIKTDVYTMASGTFTDIPGMSATITPSATSSKVLVFVSLTYGGDNYNFAGRLLRGSIEIAKNTDSGVGDNRATFAMTGVRQGSSWCEYSSTVNFLDTPSTTSATVYKVQVRNQGGAGTFWLNRSVRDNSTDIRAVSTMTLMEIAG